MCDVLRMRNNFDFSFKLPPVPARTYEIRISVSANNMFDDSRTMAKYQLYFDGKICGIPMYIQPVAFDPEIGWEDDLKTYDNGVENDKAMRNRGWMKGPDSYNVWLNSQYATCRRSHTNLRRIINIQYLGEGEHWLRYRYLGAPVGELYFVDGIELDYIEFVPLHIISDPTKPEDRH